MGFKKGKKKPTKKKSNKGKRDEWSFDGGLTQSAAASEAAPRPRYRQTQAADEKNRRGRAKHDHRKRKAAVIEKLSKKPKFSEFLAATTATTSEEDVNDDSQSDNQEQIDELPLKRPQLRSSLSVVERLQLFALRSITNGPDKIQHNTEGNVIPTTFPGADSETDATPKVSVDAIAANVADFEVNEGMEGQVEYSSEDSGADDARDKDAQRKDNEDETDGNDRLFNWFFSKETASNIVQSSDIQSKRMKPLLKLKAYEVFGNIHPVVRPHIFQQDATMREISSLAKLPHAPKLWRRGTTSDAFSAGEKIGTKVLPLAAGYTDILFEGGDRDVEDEAAEALLAHICVHSVKARNKVLRHNQKLKKIAKDAKVAAALETAYSAGKSKKRKGNKEVGSVDSTEQEIEGSLPDQDGADASTPLRAKATLLEDGVDDNSFRVSYDQGYSRARVLILCPLRAAAKELIDSMVRIFGSNTSISNMDKFLAEFSLQASADDDNDFEDDRNFKKSARRERNGGVVDDDSEGGGSGDNSEGEDSRGRGDSDERHISDERSDAEDGREEDKDQDEHAGDSHSDSGSGSDSVREDRGGGGSDEASLDSDGSEEDSVRSRDSAQRQGKRVGANDLKGKHHGNSIVRDKIKNSGPRTKPEDWKRIFEDRNVDDDFKIGIQVNPGHGKGSGADKGVYVRLFSDFFISDIIVASPIGLRLAIESSGSKEAADFLSSIEVVMLHQADILYMQNWEHVNFVLSHVNQLPKSQRILESADFSRIRPYFLDGDGARHRQLLVTTHVVEPEIQAAFRSHALSRAGSVRVKRDWGNGFISRVAAPVKQVFQIVPNISSFLTQDTARFQFFCATLLDHILRVKQNRTLIVTPSYLSYVKLRNELINRKASAVFVCEYSRESEISRGRSRFFQGLKDILLYSGRMHFFRRFHIRGARHIIFYSLPEFPHLYSEFVNMLTDEDTAGSSGRGGFDGADSEGSSSPAGGVAASSGAMTCTVVLTMYEKMALERIVGRKRCEHMLNSKKATFLFV